MLTEKFFEVISHEGVVSIISWGKGEPHVANTWNSYLTITKDNKILIPAAGMVKTEANIKENNKVKMTLGSKEVQGHFTQGAGFRLEGTAKFISSGEEYDMMKEKFPFLTRVLEITLTEVKQTL
ncbi:MAG: pyridoxamine 5'-phosphate oxidase family protein [Sarcina ventriculi]|uniref:FMN-binding protein n=1 Tax=Sarcina ventriculi TaxID=1267 RepID=A0ABM9UP15_SARVE|nr:pyridoxamine 5'-phosphate oxidase family protein [Sarcina ventriculi]MDO4403227.1 pyridoxamine 5'-phosphate oxidase family protein [Clostridiaceae bacterium]MBU5322424.1 pyridoxamine 5'-phosphate oxidase family protein [Sarcina ventriculi]MCI5636630.1 pyridoxamine 5'-phosphate oxidase family protein [Sarcina ventriculi]MDD7374208.1 pyridoxamine 5'-phosphate oxidase family protein [Sarcina ventriculi]MDY7061794.1 pyridoxamine 5'-phosphate oxidase family protein [Sarcina ventriculi]